MHAKRLNIAYLCDISPLDRNLYSGGNARIYDALQDHVGDVTILSNSWAMAEPVRQLLHKLPESINLRARWRLHLALGRVIARGVQRELARGRYDVLFTAYSFQSLARVVPPYPMVTAFTADATPTGYRQSEIGQSFGSYLSISRLLDPLILNAERRIFQAQDLLLWPADWQKDTADRLYDLTDTQSVIVPWGANIDDPGQAGAPAISPDLPLEILFIGRDWFAKGGPLVLAVVQALRAAGFDARLTVVGCTPPGDVAPWMDVHPSLDKADPQQFATFQSLFRKAHFVMMASFESWGFAFCEASAYGVPSLCLRTGGVPVRDGVNGYALPPGADAADFVAIIRKLVTDPQTYDALCASSRQEFKDRLNWRAWGQNVSGLLHEKTRLLARD